MALQRKSATNAVVANLLIPLVFRWCFGDRRLGFLGADPPSWAEASCRRRDDPPGRLDALVLVTPALLS